MLALRLASPAVAAYARARQPSRCLVTVRAQAEAKKPAPKADKITKGDLVGAGSGAGEAAGDAPGPADAPGSRRRRQRGGAGGTRRGARRASPAARTTPRPPGGRAARASAIAAPPPAAHRAAPFSPPQKDIVKDATGLTVAVSGRPAPGCGGTARGGRQRRRLRQQQWRRCPHG
jgi:hypothetical protein